MRGKPKPAPAVGGAERMSDERLLDLTALLCLSVQVGHQNHDDLLELLAEARRARHSEEILLRRIEEMRREK
jgi:hypothetical protein